MGAPSTETAKEKDAIRRAMKHLAEKGWYHPPQNRGGTCVALAIAEVTSDYELELRARERFARSAGLSSGSCTVIGSWNDHPDRTIAEVRAAMRKAAE